MLEWHNGGVCGVVTVWCVVWLLVDRDVCSCVGVAVWFVCGIASAVYAVAVVVNGGGPGWHVWMGGSQCVSVSLRAARVWRYWCV